MRYTKAALLVFGLGLGLGFVAVVGEVAWLERPAAGAMALGLASLPLVLFADGRGVRLLAWIAAGFSGRRRRPLPARPPRKPAARRPAQRRPPVRPRRRKRG